MPTTRGSTCRRAWACLWAFTSAGALTTAQGHDPQAFSKAGVRLVSPAQRAPSSSTAIATATPGSPLELTLSDRLPAQPPPLGISVAVFAGPDPDHAYLGVTLDASAFADKPGAIPLEIAVLANDEQGRRVNGSRQAGTVQVPPAATPGMTPFVELQTSLTLPPGNYEVRATVMNAETRSAATVATRVTVPAFDGARLTLSDLVLATRESAGAVPDGAPAIPVVPTTARVFSGSEPAWGFVRVYRATDKSGSPSVSIETSVLDSRGKRVKHQSLPDAPSTGPSTDVRLPVPLKDLAPGSYVLRVDAKQGRTEASRQIAFTVASAAAATVTTNHTPDLDAALAAAAAYLDKYEHRISAIGAEEQYEQAVPPPGGDAVATAAPTRQGGVNGSVVSNGAVSSTAATSRRTRANIMTIDLGSRGWVMFRDVFELDGRPVRDREERLSRVLQNVTADSLAQARQIAMESARYNLDPEPIHIDRTINVPMTALIYLRGPNQSRSSFRLGRPDRVGGVDCVTLQFTEQSLPRLVRTSDDAAAQGTFWIDMANGGRIVKTEVRMQSGGRGPAVLSKTSVTYGRPDKLDVWVPIVMDESYDVQATRQVVTGHATYSDFKEFKVTTSTDIK